jgi:hypothetical protein
VYAYFLKQSTNEYEIGDLTYDYCKEISSERSFDRELDILHQGDCQQLLFFFHQKREHGAFELLDNFNEENNVQLSEFEKKRQIKILQLHLDEFQSKAPENFTGQLLYYPGEVNIFRMLTSSVAHGDFWLFCHLYCNLGWDCCYYKSIVFFIFFYRAYDGTTDFGFVWCCDGSHWLISLFDA